MLEESRKQVEETTRILETFSTQKLDYPRKARIDYGFGTEKPDFPLAKYVRLLSIK